MLKIFESMPVLIFVACSRFIDASALENWKYPFVFSGLVALVVILVLLCTKKAVDRILLGIDLYLISGSLAFITRQVWLLGIYDRLRASGMILWVMATGITAVFMTKKGFIGVDSSDKNRIKKYSSYLLLSCVIAFIISFSLQGNMLLSELAPFAGLFYLQKALKKKILRMGQDLK